MPPPLALFSSVKSSLNTASKCAIFWSNNKKFSGEGSSRRDGDTLSPHPTPLSRRLRRLRRLDYNALSALDLAWLLLN